MRWAGVGATTTNNDGNTRTGDAGARVSGNESYHESQTQNIIGIDPDGNQFNVQTVNVQRNLPYLVSISAQMVILQPIVKLLLDMILIQTIFMCHSFRIIWSKY